MIARDIKFYIDGTKVPGCTGVSIEFRQELEEWTPFPGSADDDGWKRYRAGRLSASLSAQVNYKNTNATMFADYPYYDGETFEISNDEFEIEGNAAVVNTTIQASARSIAKMSLEFEVGQFPTFTAV